MGHSNFVIGVEIMWIQGPMSSPQCFSRLLMKLDIKSYGHFTSKVVLLIFYYQSGFRKLLWPTMLRVSSLVHVWGLKRFNSSH